MAKNEKPPVKSEKALVKSKKPPVKNEKVIVMPRRQQVMKTAEIQSTWTGKVGRALRARLTVGRGRNRRRAFGVRSS